MKADEKTSQALMDFLKPTALGLVGFMTVGACYLQYLQDGTNELKFNAVPSGRRNDTAFAYGLLSTTEQTEYLRTYTWNTNYNDASFLRLDMAALQTYHGSQYHGMPTRLVKD